MNTTPRFLLAVGTLLACLGASAQSAPTPAATDPAVRAAGVLHDRVERTLAQISGDARPIRLESQRGERIVNFPLSLRQQPESLTLRLRVTSSSALAADRSQLVVRLNGTTVGQIAHQAGRQLSIVELPLPARALKFGDYNELAFIGVQHYPTNCEVPDAPELWQEIDSLESRLVLDYRKQPVRSSVGNLDDIFDAKTWSDPHFTLFLAGEVKTPALLRASAAVARAASLRLRYQPTLFFKGELAAGAGATDGRFPGLPPGFAGDAVVIGTQQALAKHVRESVLQAINGPTLAVYADDRDPTRAVVLVAGVTADDVETAARALLASRGTPLPQGGAVGVKGVKMATAERDAAVRGINAGETRSFGQLGSGTLTSNGEAIRVDFRLPSDLYPRQRANVELELHLAYAAGLAGDSGLNIYLNGAFAAAVPLNNARGERFLAYRVALPLSVFQPGRNALRFEPMMRSSVVGECAPRGGRFPITLYADSTIKIPEASHYVRLPDLSRVRDDAFPYLAWPDGRSAAVRLLDTDKTTLEAAWTLVGKLAQVRGVSAEQIDIGLGPFKDRDELVVGALDKLPADLAAAAPLDPRAPGRVGLPGDLLAPSVAEVKLTWVERLLGAQPSRPKPVLADAPPTQLDTAGRPAGDLGVLMQMRAPGTDRSMVLVTAGAEHLAARVRTLVGYPVWNQMRGDVMLWRDDERSVYTQQVGAHWTLGDASYADRAEYWFSSEPWRLVAAAAAAVVVLAWAVWLLVRRRARARLAAIGARPEF